MRGLWDKSDLGRAYYRQYHKDNRKAHPEKYLLYWAKENARRRGLEFNLKEEDVKIPKYCPALGIPIKYVEGRQRDSSPSIDRFDNSLGYTKDNINVVSFRANSLKKDGTLEELRSLVRWLENAALAKKSQTKN